MKLNELPDSIPELLEMIDNEKKDPPAFRLYAGDFLADTADWSVEEVGIHIRLLSIQWANRKLSTDIERLGRASGCANGTFEKAWETVKVKYIEHEGNLYNIRLEKERIIQRYFSNIKALAGKKGALSRWHSHGTAIGNANGKPYGKTMAKDYDTDTDKDTEKNIDIIIESFNKICGTKYRTGEKSVRENIGARLRDYSVDDCVKVIQLKHEEWQDDPKMIKYLRPSTLFRPKNFPQYLNQLQHENKPAIKRRHDSFMEKYGNKIMAGENDK